MYKLYLGLKTCGYRYHDSHLVHGNYLIPSLIHTLLCSPACGKTLQLDMCSPYYGTWDLYSCGLGHLVGMHPKDSLEVITAHHELFQTPYHLITIDYGNTALVFSVT